MFWKLVGVVAIILTAIQLLPQIIKSLKTKRVEDISLGLGLIVALNAITWISYGIHFADYAVIIANILNFICATILLILKLKSFKNYNSVS